MFEKLDEEVKAFFIKITIPALGGIALKLSVMAKRGKLTWFNAITSTIIGIVVTSLFGLAIIHYFESWWIWPVSAVLAISSEKISSYFIDKFNVEAICKEALGGFIQKYFKK